MKITNIISGSLLGLTILTGGAIVNAQQTDRQIENPQTVEKRGGKHFGRGGHGGRGAERKFAALNLTEAQTAQMQQIRQRFRESTENLREQLRAAREAERAATENNSFNESAIRAAAQSANNARVELQVAEAKMRFELFNVLTAEQKTQLEQLKQQRRQQFEQRREQFKARRQAAQPIS